MTRPVIVNPLAEEDLSSAFSWYEEQRNGLGLEFLECVSESIDRIQRSPELAGKIYGEVRRALIKRFPFGVFYRIDADQITIVAVYHARRDPRSWQARGDS